MRISELKQGVYEGLMLVEFDDNTDKLIVSCVMYSFIKNLLSVNTENENNSKNIVKSYSSVIKNNFNIYKNSAVSYNIIRKTIEGYNKNGFLEFNSSQIDNITALYRNKTKTVPFATTSFSQYMYKVFTMKHSSYIKLSKIHFDIMVPIIKYYQLNNGVNPSDLEIFDAELYAPTPGKEMLFTINGINPGRIVSDIKANRIPIRDKIYLVKTANPYIQIITN